MGRDLRKLAEGQDCKIRLPGICNHDRATTILAHFRMVGISGLGLKSPDLIAAHACSSCHDAADRRSHTELELDYVRLAHLEGMARTLAWLIKNGHIEDSGK